MQIVRQLKVLRKRASRGRSLRFLVLAVILIGEITVSFTGGLIVRNPWLPNYLVDRVSGHNQGVATENVKPPPPPGTAIEYLNLMNYDVKVLTPAERTVASILNDAVAHLDMRKPPFQIFSQQILPKIETVQPGEDLTKVRAAVQQCQDIANSAVHYYQDLSEQLTAKLTAAGVPAATAHETAETFAKWAQAVGNVPWPIEVNKACTSITTLLDVLSENSTEWTRQSDGHLLFTSQQLLNQYNAATTDLNAAIKAINGG
jgi:CHASE3 domain sensor protein